MWKEKRIRKINWKECHTIWKEGIKGKKRVILLVGLAAVIPAVFFWQNHLRKVKQEREDLTAVKTAVVTKGTLTSELTSSGTISPKDTYEITSLVEGEILSADFEEGDQVSEGQILYQIDVSSMESEINSAMNSLERANNSYEEAVEDYNEAAAELSGNTYKSTRTGFIRNLKVQEGDKISSNTELAEIYNDQTMKIRLPFLSAEAAQIPVGTQAVVTLTDTQEELSGVVTAVSNMDEVLEGGRLVRYVSVEVINPGGLTTSHTATVMAGTFRCSEEGTFQPAVDTGMQADISGNGSLEIEEVLVHDGDYVTNGTPMFRIKAKDVEDVLRNFQDAVDTAKERVETAQSKADTTQDTYENYTITAPISGQVITKTMKAGDKISRSSNSGDTAMAVIYDLSEYTFEMSVDELDVSKVKVGQEVEVTADAVEGKTFRGTVTNVSLQGSQSNGVTNYPVTVTLDETEGLLPGMNVDGKIILDEVENALMIPIDALMRGNRVYIKDESITEEVDGVPAGFRAAEVEIGLTSDSYVEILSGLNEGDQVYVDQTSKSSQDAFVMGGPDGGFPAGQGGPGAQGGPAGGRGGMR